MYTIAHYCVYALCYICFIVVCAVCSACVFISVLLRVPCFNDIVCSVVLLCVNVFFRNTFMNNVSCYVSYSSCLQVWKRSLERHKTKCPMSNEQLHTLTTAHILALALGPPPFAAPCRARLRTGPCSGKFSSPGPWYGLVSFIYICVFIQYLWFSLHVVVFVMCYCLCFISAHVYNYKYIQRVLCVCVMLCLKCVLFCFMMVCTIVC